MVQARMCVICHDEEGLVTSMALHWKRHLQCACDVPVHAGCLSEWHARHAQCPICRTPFRTWTNRCLYSVAVAAALQFPPSPRTPHGHTHGHGRDRAGGGMLLRVGNARAQSTAFFHLLFWTSVLFWMCVLHAARVGMGVDAGVDPHDWRGQ